MSRRPFRVLLIRPAQGEDDLPELDGLEIIRFKGIRLDPHIDTDELQDALTEGADYLVFTSATALPLLIQLLRKTDMWGRFLNVVDRSKVAAIGPKTRNALIQHDIKVDIVPKDYCSKGLAEALIDVMADNKRILTFRSLEASDELASMLRVRGAEVREIRFYMVKPTKELEDAARKVSSKSIEAVAFTSSSAVHLLDDELRKRGSSLADASSERIHIFSIGPSTSRALGRLGVRGVIEAQPHTVTSLMEIVWSHRGELRG
ncbi:MAG: hypothetical protein GTN80_06305 [Nitrososphaeria archaeon]|nr:hypothetical protein [Nitrososphaeria archaeon]NIQ33238.1 hypothetical protein [Nitrososphaeria archaeon]